MSQPPHQQKPKQSNAQPDKAAKLAGKLRENLKRRKQQVRQRGLDPANAGKTGFRIDVEE